MASRVSAALGEITCSWGGSEVALWRFCAGHRGSGALCALRSPGRVSSAGVGVWVGSGTAVSALYLGPFGLLSVLL